MRRATQMTIAIVSLYLLANMIHVILSIVEFQDPALLEDMEPYYTYTTDAVSVFTQLTLGVRIIIYCIFNKDIRHAVAAASCCTSVSSTDDTPVTECDGFRGTRQCDGLVNGRVQQPPPPREGLI